MCTRVLDYVYACVRACACVCGSCVRGACVCVRMRVCVIEIYGNNIMDISVQLLVGRPYI